MAKKKTKKRAKTVRVTVKDRERFFKWYCEKQSTQYVTNKSPFSDRTIKRWRKKDKWDERLKAIQAKAVKKADVVAVDELAEEIKMVKFCIAATLEQIKEMAKSGDKQIGGDVSKDPMKNLDTMIRLKQFLKGEPDSRTEISKVADKYAEMTVEELEAEAVALQQLQKDLEG